MTRFHSTLARLHPPQILEMYPAVVALSTLGDLHGGNLADDCPV